MRYVYKVRFTATDSETDRMYVQSTPYPYMLLYLAFPFVI